MTAQLCCNSGSPICRIDFGNPCSLVIMRSLRWHSWLPVVSRGDIACCIQIVEGFDTSMQTRNACRRHGQWHIRVVLTRHRSGVVAVGIVRRHDDITNTAIGQSRGQTRTRALCRIVIGIGHRHTLTYDRVIRRRRAADIAGHTPVVIDGIC